MNCTKRSVMKICVYGVGGVGGYFGGLMAHNASKHSNKRYEIDFIARGEHLKAIKEKGLLLKMPGNKEIVCQPDMAIENVSELGYADIIFLCVKGYDLPDTLAHISEIVKDDTVIIPILNGADIYERIKENLKKGVVLPSCAYLSSAIEKPGVVTFMGGAGLLITGKDPEYPEFDYNEVNETFKDLGINYKWMDNSFPAVWEKYIFIAAFGLVTAYSNSTIGQVMENPQFKNMTKGIMEEIVSISRASGIELRDTIVEESLNKANSFAYDTKTSYQRDVEQKKAKNEGELFGGTIIRLGEKYSIDTPFTKKVYNG